MNLDQPLDPRAHAAWHASQAEAVTRFVNAMRAGATSQELIDVLAAAPTAGGSTYGEILTPDEIAEFAGSLSAHDPEVMGVWADEGFEAWAVVPELEAWPGEYRGPLLFIGGDPEAGGMSTPDAVAYNLERYPWAEHLQMTGLGHDLGLDDDPGPVVDHIRGFFDGLG